MLTHVVCGWSGQRSELVPEYWHSFLLGHVCPKCEGSWIDFVDYDEDDYCGPPESEPNIVDSKSRELWKKSSN